MESDCEYVAVTNIPNNFHAADLRAHFSAFVESCSFICFHYRHRPEKNAEESKDTSKSKSMFCCGVIQIRKSRLKDFQQRYNNEQWLDASNNYSVHRCNISVIETAENSHSCNEDCATCVKKDKLLSMPEFKPPELMPNGNVGTPTHVFLDFIQRCLLPDRLINILKLKFPKTEGKRVYSNVKYDYQDCTKSTSCEDDKNINNIKCGKTYSYDTTYCGKTSRLGGKDNCTTENCESDNNAARASHLSQSNRTKNSCETDNSVTSTSSDIPCDQNTLTKKEKRKLKKLEREETRRLMNENIEERLIDIERKYRNDEDAEEWDRHEAIEDDPSNQERNKERLYEEEIEQPWEKGGPGVVFYTDAIYWQAREGDFDEQTADDLDVDFSPYEGDGPGDKDIRDFLKIQQERRFRSGYDKTDRFSIGLSTRPDPDDRPTSFSSLPLPGPSVLKKPKEETIGRFEIHTRGVGRKIMEKQGWTDGQGLGKTELGIKQALKGEGQGPRKKMGLGFIKPEPVSYGPSNRKKVKVSKNRLITTTLDSPYETDPKEKLLERQEPTTLKYRKSYYDHFSPGP